MQKQMITLFNYAKLKAFRMFIFIFPFLFIVNAIVMAEDTSVRICGNHKEIKELINAHFPDYVLMDIDELDAFAKDVFKKHYPQSNPHLVCRDFDGNGLIDYALLLRNSKKKGKQTIFTIFLQSSHSYFKLAHHLNLEFYRDDVYIIPIEPGRLLSQTPATDAPSKEIRLKNAAVELVYVGKAALAYYWDDKSKSFATICTAD